MVKAVETTAQPRKPGRPATNFTTRRDEIILTATRLFAEQGFRGTSINDICEAAGVGRGLLYHYVTSKEEILFAIHERFIGPLLDRGFEIVSAGGPPSETLVALSRDLMNSIAEYKDETTVFLHEWKVLRTNEEQWLAVVEKRRAYETLVRKTIETGQRQGIFRQLDAHILMLGFLGMHNYAYQWLNPTGRLSAEEIAAVFSEIFICGLALPD